MHNNYYLLRKLSKEIAHKVANGCWYEGKNDTIPLGNTTEKMLLLACFSQSKDELVLGFGSRLEEFYIKAVLNADFSCLTFPAEFHRAKKNSVDLFKELQGLAVQCVRQYLNERSFCLFFEQGYQLLFKMHGRRSNIVLYRNNVFVIGFHKRMENDKHIDLENYDRIIPQTYSSFEEQHYDWGLLYPTFGKEINEYLVEMFSNQEWDSNYPKQWDFIQELLRNFEKPLYFLVGLDTIPTLSLIPPIADERYLTYSTALQAYNEFYYSYTHTNTLGYEKNLVLRQLQKRRKQLSSYIDKNTQKLVELEDSKKNEETANLIMANLHLIAPHSTEVEVFDFYHQQNRIIKLKKEISAQKNAESYYRKAKNQKIEVEVLQKNIRNKEKELKEIARHLQQIQVLENVKELRKYLKNNHLGKEEREENTENSLFKRFYFQGFDILVGKNAKNNDLLTQKYAYKEDLWLHAKDVSGSHVVVKYKAGQQFPEEVIEKAAQLAAYFSKRSRDSLCPVIVTPRKFVRKTKDLADGAVIVEKEEIVLVVPEPF